MSKSFLERRHKSPDYDIEAWITGVKIPNTDWVHWDVQIEGEDDLDLAAGILERAADGYKGHEVTDATVRRLLCPSCSVRVVNMLNDLKSDQVTPHV